MWFYIVSLLHRGNKTTTTATGVPGVKVDCVAKTLARNFSLSPNLEFCFEQSKLKRVRKESRTELMFNINEFVSNSASTEGNWYLFPIGIQKYTDALSSGAPGPRVRICIRSPHLAFPAGHRGQRTLTPALRLIWRQSAGVKIGS